MQYCKNCGRQLKDGMRFCDRCGQSVRKAQESGQTARHREIRELQEERLNRKKYLEEKERKQQRIKENRRKNNNGCLFVGIIVLIVVACLSVYIGHRLGQSSSNTDNLSPVSTSQPVVTPATSVSGTYQEIMVGNIRCPYPSSFHPSGTVSGNEKMSLTDPLGGAKMVIAQEARSDSAMELAKEYIAKIGAGAQDTMKKGDDWYSVTASVNGTVHHRKCIVRKGLAVYYDFEYSESSGSASTYEGYIEEIDKNFK